MKKMDVWLIKAHIRCQNAAELLKNDDGIGTVEMILILVDNPFTSSTYILSY